MSKLSYNVTMTKPNTPVNELRDQAARKITKRMSASRRVTRVLAAAATLYCASLVVNTDAANPDLNVSMVDLTAASSGSNDPNALDFAMGGGFAIAGVAERSLARRQCQRTVLLFGKDNDIYVMDHGKGTWHKSTGAFMDEAVDSVSVFAAPILAGVSGLMGGMTAETIINSLPSDSAFMTTALGVAAVATGAIALGAAVFDGSRTDALTLNYVNDLNGRSSSVCFVL